MPKDTPRRSPLFQSSSFFQERQARRGHSRVLLAWLLTASLAWPALAERDAEGKEGPQVYRGAEVSEVSVPYVFEGDLRDLPKAGDWQPGDPIKEIPRLRHGAALKDAVAGKPTGEQDPLLARQAAAAIDGSQKTFTTPDLNINGQGFTGVNPPDPTGDVGYTYYIQAINAATGARFTVHDKDTGAIVAGPTNMDTLAAGGSPCASGLGDPIVLYDHLAGCWMMSEFSSSGNRLCVYISQTSDPVTGGWFAYEFSATNFPDYPKYGVWPDAYYVGTNESSPRVYAMDRANMLAGNPATMQSRTVPALSGFGFQMLQPADIDGALAPPGGSPGWFIRHRDDERHNPGSNDTTQDFLEIWELDVDWANPASTTLTGPSDVGIAEIDSELCGFFSFSCFPQPSGSNNLDPLREVVMRRLQYRNHGMHETLVANLVTDVNGTNRGGVRWFELRKACAATWNLHQEGTYSPDATNRWMGSASMDRDGDIALGYNVTSSSVSPGLRYTGRLVTDPLGIMSQPETTLVAGSGSNGSIRYGDYSSMSVDPEDECTFWFTGQYNPSSSWSTRIGKWDFDACDTDGNCVTPPSGMVAWYPFDETTGSTAADIQNGHDGSHQGGPTRLAGKVDFALDLDGSNDWVRVADDPDLDFGTGDFSIDAWIRTTDSSGTIVSKRVYNGSSRWTGYIFMINGNRLLLQMATVTQNWRNFQSAPLTGLTDGRWHHVAVTVDRNNSSGGRMYVDGSLVYTFNPTSRTGSLSNGAQLEIGRTNGNSWGGATFYLDGTIDELELFKRSLPASEVLGLFQADSDGKCKGRRPIGPIGPIDLEPLSVALACEGDFVEHICVANPVGGEGEVELVWQLEGEGEIVPEGDSVSVFLSPDTLERGLPVSLRVLAYDAARQRATAAVGFGTCSLGSTK